MSSGATNRRRSLPSKFAKWPNYRMAKKGYIGVQEHDFKVEFKNIKVKVLS
jgi:hypothetical protein